MTDLEFLMAAGAPPPPPTAAYSHAVRAGDFLFVTGQLATISGDKLVDGGIVEQTHQVMRNLKAILAEAAIDFHRVVKTTIFLSDMSLFSAVNEVYGSYFKGDFPARETVAVKGLPKNVNVEISMIAAK